MKVQLLCAAAAALIAGCNTPPPLHTPYDGLLPQGYQVPTVTEPLPVAQLKQMTVAVVPSTNLEQHVKVWVDYYEKGGSEKTRTMLNVLTAATAVVNPAAALGANIGTRGNFDEATAGGRNKTDPRVVIDATVLTLRRHFKEVVIATDLAGAQDLKADYMVVVDHHATYNSWGSKYITRTGVHMLDRGLRQVYSRELAAEVERIDPPFMSGVQASIDANAQTVANGIQGSLKPVMAALESRLAGGR